MKTSDPNTAHLEKINIRKEIAKYLRNWPWFVVCVIIFVTMGYVYLRYTTPLYSARTKIILKDENAKNSESVIFSDLGILNGSTTQNIENELGILRSKRLMNEVVKSLNLHIQYFIKGQFNAVEIYENLPFSLHVMRFDEKLLKQMGGARFEVWISDNNQIRIKNLTNGHTRIIKSDESVDLGFASIIIRLKDKKSNASFSASTIVHFSGIESVASNFRNKITVIQAEKNSNLVELELTDPIKERARDVLDQLILEYNRSAIEDKNLIAGNTSNFINERLAIINEELDSVETGKKNFKQQNLMTDIHAESQMYIQNASDYNKRKQEIGTQLELTNAMLEYLSSNSRGDLLPTNLGLAEGGVNDQIDAYNSIVLQRNKILAGSSDKNPVIIQLNNQINQIKENVVQSLNTTRSNLLISQEEIRRQASSIGSKIYAVPTKELQYRGIERQQNIKETLYLFLLQKREENSLAMAATEPKAKIVDSAYFNDYPISPNSRSIYLGTILLGLFVPFSVIYIWVLLDNKVRKRIDIENFNPEIPLVGEIPQIKQKLKIIKNNDRSILAESFRILTTNLQYLLVNHRSKTSGITLLVTSTIKGEGKTFTSVNLAGTLANSSNKVLILGADLRNSQLQPYIIDQKQNLGISDYLIDDSLRLENIIQKSSINSHLDIMLSGSHPPNPYELLKNGRMDLLLDKVKNYYDFIIIDTAPSMLVADTFLLTGYADIILYIVRAGYTEKDLLEFPINAKEKGKFLNVAFVLNNVTKTNLGYGNSYGYGYRESKQRSWHGRNKVPAYNV